jgi:hypothetical protein
MAIRIARDPVLGVELRQKLADDSRAIAIGDRSYSAWRFERSSAVNFPDR